MITINDYDIPIEAAKKIILGKRPSTLPQSLKKVAEKITGEENVTEDMYTLEEIKEIAEYLMVYYNNNQ